MDTIKSNYKIIVGVVLVVFFIGLVISRTRDERSVVAYGIAPLMSEDCKEVKDAVSYPANISFSVNRVSEASDAVQDLVTKYKGSVTNNSFSSYQGENNKPVDSATITVNFEASAQTKFLEELDTLIKSMDGKGTGYSYNGGASQYGSSAYASCMTYLQNVKADMLQLEIFTKALKDERNLENISLLGQSIYNAKNNLQNDVTYANQFFADAGKPLVTVYITSSSYASSVPMSGGM